MRFSEPARRDRERNLARVSENPAISILQELEKKKGYSPPPVARVQRPKPPPAGPRQRPAVSSQQRPQNGGGRCLRVASSAQRAGSIRTDGGVKRALSSVKTRVYGRRV